MLGGMHHIFIGGRRVACGNTDTSPAAFQSELEVFVALRGQCNALDDTNVQELNKLLAVCHSYEGRVLRSCVVGVEVRAFEMHAHYCCPAANTSLCFGDGVKGISDGIS